MSFKEVTGRYNGPALEEEVLEFWREHNTFEKTLEHTSHTHLITYSHTHLILTPSLSISFSLYIYLSLF